MAFSAPVQVDLSFTDDETVAFTFSLERDDGTAFPFAAYEVEYAIDGHLLTSGNGLTIAAPNIGVKIARGELSCGAHRHGCRVREIATGDETQVFDGTLTITEGAFA